MSSLNDKLFEITGTDQPGRLLAVFVLAPIILFKALQYKDIFLAIFAIALFIWDLYWLLTQPPRKKKTEMFTMRHLLP